MGVIRGIDKYYLMRHAIAMVHMALWESYGNVLREGMSQGLICITSNVYNMPLLVKDGTNGFLVPSGDYKLMAAKMIMLLNDRTLRHQMGNEGFSIQSNNFLDDDMVNSIEELYNHLIKSQATK